MLTYLRAGVVIAILAYWPGLLEQFESPKAAVVRVIGCGLLAAVVTRLWIMRRGPQRSSPPRVGASGGRRDAARAHRGQPVPAAGGTEARAWHWEPLDVCMAAWLLVEFASTGASSARTVSVFGDTEQFEGLLTSLGLAGLYAAARFAAPGSARRTLWVVLGAVAMACAVGLWQLATFDRGDWQNAPTYLGWYRPFGSLGHANLLGLMGATALSATVGLAASRALGRWWVAGVMLFGTITVLTLSRAAWVAAVTGSMAALALIGPWRRRVGRTGDAAARRTGGRTAIVGLAVGSLILVALFTLVGPLRARMLELLTVGSGSGRARLEIWKTALAMWRAHPWLGSGPDTFCLLFNHHQTATYWTWEWGTTAFHAHSIYLNTLATRGIAGVLAAGAVLGAAIASIHAARRWDAGDHGTVVALAASLVALSVAGLGGALGVAGAALVACILGTLPGLAAPRPATRARSIPAQMRSSAPLLAGGVASLLVLWPTFAQLRASRAAFLSAQEERAWRAIALAKSAAELAPWSDVMQANAADVLRRSASRTPDNEGTLALAEQYARRAIHLAPQRLYDRSELALVLALRTGGRSVERDRAAAAAIADCIALAPYNINPLIHYCDAATLIGRPDLALPVAQRAVEIYPQEAVSRAVLGEAHMALGDRAAAGAALERALTLAWHGQDARRERVQRSLAKLRGSRMVLGGR